MQADSVINGAASLSAAFARAELVLRATLPHKELAVSRWAKSAWPGAAAMTVHTRLCLNLK